MNIERHVFGSFQGYMTLARSPGVTQEDCRVLESGAFAFGQSNDKAFSKSLAKNPAYFTRVLPGSRRGLTRVFEGANDDNGRPTLLLITLILKQEEWDGQLWGDVNVLLHDAKLWAWNQRPDLNAIAMDAPAPRRKIANKSVTKLLSLISEVERNIAGGRPVVVSPNDYSADEIALLEMLIPPSARRQFTSAWRSLSARLPVSVNCPAAEAGKEAATFRDVGGTAALSTYAGTLANTKLVSGTIPLEEVLKYRGFGDPNAGASASGPRPAEKIGPAVVVYKKRSIWPLTAAIATAVVIGPAGFLAGQYFAKKDAAPAAGGHAATQPVTQPATQPAATQLPKPSPTLAEVIAIDEGKTSPEESTTKPEATATTTATATTKSNDVAMVLKIAELDKKHKDALREIEDLRKSKKAIASQLFAALSAHAHELIQSIDSVERVPAREPDIKKLAGLLGASGQWTGEEEKEAKALTTTFKFLQELPSIFDEKNKDLNDADLICVGRITPTTKDWSKEEVLKTLSRASDDYAGRIAKLKSKNQPGVLSNGLKKDLDARIKLWETRQKAIDTKSNELNKTSAQK